MARNKHPEETIRKILDVSFHLFRSKGYEHTTIQDIVNALGMSKGAVYHHFKSKEEILDRISDAYYEKNRWFQDIRLSSDLNGIEKLRKIMCFLLSDRTKLEMDSVAMPLIHDPKMVTLSLTASMKDSAPFFQAIMEEGIADGSIMVKQPKEMAEVFMLLMNIWIGVYASTPEDFSQKLAFIKEFTDGMGFPILDDHMLQVGRAYFDSVLVEARAKTKPS